MQQMQELQEAARLRGRRDKKRRQEAKHKARVRAAQLALGEHGPLRPVACMMGPVHPPLFADDTWGRVRTDIDQVAQENQ